MVPEQYQKYVTPQVVQRPVYPAAVELAGERQAVKWVPSAENPSVMVAVPKEFVQPMQPSPPRDLAPQPLIDPIAQRMVGGGALGAGVGWGAAQVFNAIAGAGTGLLAFALLLLAARLVGGRTSVTIHQEVHQHSGWFGSNNTTM